MYRGKHEIPAKGTRKFHKSGILLASLLLIIALGVGTTIAYLMDVTSEVKNTFTPTSSDITVTEKFEDNIKKDVIISNGGEIPVYVRASLAIYWTDSKGVIVKPNGCEHSPIVLGANWFAVGDIYYYALPLKHGETASDLLAADLKTTITPDGVNYNLVVEVLAEAIQANPTAAVEDAWKDVNVNADGNLVKASTTGGGT